MRFLPVSNKAYFYGIGYFGDFFSFQAVLAETFFAARVLNATEMQLGILGGCNAFGYTVSCIAAGLLSEKHGRRLMIGFGIFGMTVAYILTPFASTMKLLYAASFLRSVTTAFLWPPLMAWMVEISHHRSFSGFLGGYNVAWASGQLTGFFMAGLLFEHMGPATPFHLAATLGVLTLLFVLLTTPREGGLEEPAPPESLPPNPRRFIVAGLAVNTVSVIVFSLVLYMSPKVVGPGMGETAQGGLQAMRVIGQIATFYLMSRTRAWHFRQWPAWMCIVMFAAGCLIIANTQVYGVYLLGFAILGLATGVAFTMCAYYSLALASTKGLGSGMMETFIGGGNLLGPLYGGIVARATSPRIAVMAGLVPLAILSAYLLKVKQRSKQQQ